jgi:hypothetical protein
MKVKRSAYSCTIVPPTLAILLLRCMKNILEMQRPLVFVLVGAAEVLLLGDV